MMERKLAKIAEHIKKELGSVKMMVLSIMMSFGLVLSIIYFVVNVFSTLESLKTVKEYMQSPYDAQLNSMISMSVNVAFVIQIAGFFLSFIPLALLTWGIYLLYINAKRDNMRFSGLKLTRGVLKYHGIVSFVGAGLLVVAGIVVFVLSIVFGSELGEYIGDTSGEFQVALLVMAVVCLIVLIIVGLFYVGKGAVIMTIAGNIKYLENALNGKLFKKMSVFGSVVLLIAGIDSLLGIFSNITSVGISGEDIAMLEEMLGGEVAHLILDTMPSKLVQFETMAVTIAYTFFIGVAQIMAAVVLLGIRSKINKVLEEQEVVNYGGDNFIGGN